MYWMLIETQVVYCGRFSYADSRRGADAPTADWGPNGRCQINSLFAALKE